MKRQSEDEAAIKKLAEDWRTGWDRSDTEALLSLCTDDPILMPQDQPAALREKDGVKSCNIRKGILPVHAKRRAKGQVYTIDKMRLTSTASTEDA